MTDFLTYDLKVAVLIAVFYMFYRLMLSQETFHRVNRVVLLLTAIASFALPLCVITMHETMVIEALPQVTIDEPLVQTEMLPSVEEPQTPFWQKALPVLYIIGVVLTVGHTLLSILKVVMLIRQTERHPQPDGTIICVTGNAAMAPFSWMHYIVMNRGDYEAQDAAILAHERGHARLRHSWDLLLVDLLTALQWFNPAIWMLRQDLRTIHEYEADGEVLSQGINARQYQYLLVSKAASIGGYSIANGISHSTLKKRIHMMKNIKSKSSHLLKLLALVPIVGVTLALNARTVTDYVYNHNEPQKQTPVKKGKQAGSINVGGKAIEVVEQTAAQSAEQPTELSAIADKGEPAKVNGVIKDRETGEPIVGAALVIAGSTKGAVTDKEGKFSLEAHVGDKVTIMYPGMESTTIDVNRKEIEWFYIDLVKEGGDKSKKIFDVVDNMPQFPGGGPSALFEYLTTSIRYPKDAMEQGIQGRAIVTFVVEKDGSISGARVVKSYHPSLDAEALRIINAMPNWIPGSINGEPARVKYTAPVTFRLQGDKPANLEEAKKVVTEEAAKSDFQIEVDGVLAPKGELVIANLVNPDDIDTLYFDKTRANKVLVIKTKKKQ